MKNRFPPLVTGGFVLVVILTACNAGSSPSQLKPSPDLDPTDQTSPASPNSEPDQANLLTYDGTSSNFPITAQYPDTMQVDGGCADEGCGFFFTFTPQGNAMDNAEIHIFLPAGAATAADQEPFVTGPEGLIDGAGWTVSSIESDGSEQFPYPWVKTVIHFSTEQAEAGHILLGQTDGQAVQVILKYPAEMAATYWDSATVVLNTLKFDADLLPLSVSTEGSTEGEDSDTMCDPDNESC